MFSEDVGGNDSSSSSSMMMMMKLHGDDEEETTNVTTTSPTSQEVAKISPPAGLLKSDMSIIAVFTQRRAVVRTTCTGFGTVCHW